MAVVLYLLAGKVRLCALERVSTCEHIFSEILPSVGVSYKVKI